MRSDVRPPRPPAADTPQTDVVRWAPDPSAVPGGRAGRYAELFRHAPVCMFVLDGDGHVEDLNDIALDRLGVAQDELVGQPFLLLVAPADRNVFLHHRSRARSGFRTSVEVELLSRVVNPLRVQLDTVRVGRARDHCVLLSTATEVTARAVAEEALRRATSRLTAVIEAAPLGIVGIDESGQVELYNEAAARVLGWEEGEGLGQHVGDARTATAELDALCKRLVAGETLDAKEVRLPAGGADRTVHVAGGPMQHAEDEPGGAVLVLTDVSEQRRLEERVRHAQKLEALGQLAGGIAHDFNNLLTAILSGASLVARRLPGESPLHREVEGITASARRAAALTRQLLMFSRRGDRPRVVSAVDQTLADLDGLLRRVLPENIHLAMHLGAPGVAVRLSAEEISQVVVNLAVNARDAMPEGGRLELRTHAANADGRDIVVLEVRDTGVGIPVELQARIFEPFFTTKPVGQGTGLGLATVYGLVHGTDGSIGVSSTPGAGTTFVVTLPAIAVSAGDILHDEESANLAGTETLLLVEDEPLVRESMRAALATFGYRVLAASGLEDAARVLAGGVPDLAVLVTDMVLPTGNGLEVATLVRAWRPGIPVILISGYVPEHLRGGGEIPDDYVLLPKPFTPEDLARTLRAELAGARGR